MLNLKEIPMTSTYQLLGLPDVVTTGFVTIATIAMLVPYAAGQDLGIFKVPKVSPSLTRRLRWVGPLLFCLSLLGFASLWPTYGPLQAKDEPWVRASEIEDLDVLIRSFVLPTSPPPALTLKFHCDRWPIRMEFRAAEALPTSELLTALLGHFRIEDHVSFDLDRFPAGSYRRWSSEWVLTVNGEEISTYGTIKDAGIRDGDIIRLKMQWMAPVAFLNPPENWEYGREPPDIIF
jgi:hypothetical protein